MNQGFSGQRLTLIRCIGGGLGLYKCSCGSIVKKNKASVKYGNTRSCGCLLMDILSHRNKNILSSHRMSDSPEYRSWSAMKDRCLTKTNKDYANYGSRGISICKRWLVFDNFLEDMGPRPKGSSIGRINNNGNYEPSNCKWESARDQSNNRRSSRIIEYGGKKYSLAEATRRFNLTSRQMLRHRLESGWSVEEAIEIKVNHSNRIQRSNK